MKTVADLRVHITKDPAVRLLMQAVLIGLIVSVTSAGRAGANKDLYEKINALAQKGNAEAQYHLGMMFNNGIGVEKNPKKAFEWFQRSADGGDPFGAYKLGCYFSGQFKGVVPVNKEKALEFKLIAARAGYSLAQHDVGILFYGQQNYDEALKWWEAAAAQGYPSALYNLSVIYKEGKAVQKDHGRAYAYFKLAKLAAEGKINSNAQATLDELARELNADDLKKAEQFVSQWKSMPTPVTQKASQGLDAARQLAGR